MLNVYRTTLVACIAAILLFANGAFADTLGEQTTFRVDSAFDASGRSSLTATLRRIGARAYGYVEDAYYANLTASNQQSFLGALDSVLATFDTAIYPKLTALFGPPWEPGIDNDLRLTILSENLRGSFGGYINTADEFPTSRFSRSNQREMVYVNPQLSAVPRTWWSVLAHEFTHLITFSAKNRTHNVEEDLWLNEARAEYGAFVSGAETPFSGSNLSSRFAAFRSKPSDSVTEFLGGSEDYGSVAVFAQYLGGLFGDDVFGQSLLSPRVGIASLDEALAREEGAPTFAQVFRDFLAAVWVNDRNLGPAYSFLNPEVGGATVKPLQPTHTVSVIPGTSAALSQTAKDWAGQWVTFTGSGSQASSGGKALELTLQGSVPLVASLVLTRSDGTQEVIAGTVALPQQSVTLNASDFGTSVQEATLAFALAGKTSDFTQQEPLRTWSILANLIESAPFSISQALPAQVIASGGIEVTLAGQGFTPDLSLSLRGLPIPYTFVDGTRLRFIAPALSPGQPCITLADSQNVSATNCTALTVLDIAEGSLIRARNDIRVSIVMGPFIRHIVSSDIFSFYGHLSFAGVQEVAPEALAQFKSSAWVRADGDRRVYEINDDGTKHWINMTAEEFAQSGRSWDAVYVVNSQERDWYQTGTDVLFR